MQTQTIQQQQREINKGRLAISSHLRAKEYKIRIFANDDVYESLISACRVSVTSESIILYDKHESIVAIYPSSKTELTLNK